MPRNGYDDFMGFFGQDAEGVISGRTKDPVTGKVKATFMDGLFGRSQSELDTAQTQMETTQSRAGGKRYAEESGYTAAELGLDFDKTSTGAVKSKIRLLEESRQSDRDRVNHSRSLEPTRMTLAANSQQLNAQIERDRLKFNYMEGRDANIRAENKAERLDDKAEQRRERLDLLDRQDHRYAQEMQRYDKRRQTETIQGLMGGLASLGAAFAM
jgi:hypothetical protein